MGNPNILEASESYSQIKAFMKGAGQSTPDHYQLLTPEERVLRARLFLEEALKTIVLGLGIQIGVKHRDGLAHIDRPESGGKFLEQFTLNAHWGLDMTEFVDGVMDINVVGLGGLVAAGLPDAALRREVDANNLLKIANRHTDPETGKFIKPKDHPAPNIAGVLEDIISAQIDAAILAEAQTGG
jgi:predicted HAD superfamily Cof-like phosphohydrolase